MGKFIDYPRTYELVMTDEKMLRRNCHLDYISIYNNIPGSVDVYRMYFEKTMREFQLQAFDHLVKFRWLRDRFCYRGVRRDRTRTNPYIDAAYGIFVRHYVGYEFNLFFSLRYGPLQKLLKYVDDIIPDLDERNPFTEKIAYPYTYVQFEHMILVYQLEERMDLLNHAEKHKMRYTTFFDYVINYIKSYNEKEYKYELVKGGDLFPTYVKDMIAAQKKYERMKARADKVRGERLKKLWAKKKKI